MGKEIVEDDGRSGRFNNATADENVMAVHTLVICDRMQDLRSIASEVGINFGVVKSTLIDILGMSKVSAKWVPRMLTHDQIHKNTGISRPAVSTVLAIL